MNVVTSAKWMFGVLSVSALLSAEVYANMKAACVPCHTTGNAQAVNFKIDSSSATTYTNVQPLINKSAPDQSKLILVGKGGMYTPSGGGAQVAHSQNLRDPMLSNWISWITAGALQ
jgi:hypothetical protein